MKRALLLALAVSFQVANAELVAPKWEEFAPPDMVDAQAGPLREISKDTLLVASFIPIWSPFWSQVKDRDADERRNYWAQRRIQFDQEVATCGETTTDKALCYLQVRQMESQKTAERQAHSDRINAIRFAN